MTATNTSTVDPTKEWPRIGTVVGEASTGTYSFILKSLEGKLGDIVATQVDVPRSEAGSGTVTVWGRITSINRFNPFFPAEAAQELANENIRLLDTVLSGSRDHLEAEVLILGSTFGSDGDASQLTPLTYPVKPSASVLYPPPDAVRKLLTGDDDTKSSAPARLLVGSLIARSDVAVHLSAKDIVSRHLAILAMTGGGKTVAARRIIRELVDLAYPLVIFDPHGDYLGFYEKRERLRQETRVQILYPVIRVRHDNVGIIADLIDKMGKSLTDPQQQFYNYLVSSTDFSDGIPAAAYIQKLIDHASNVHSKKNKKDKADSVHEDIQDTRATTISVVKRSLDFVRKSLIQMEANNERLRGKFKQFEFKEMPDPKGAPEEIVNPGLVSIFYLAGYDHLNQSAIVSIVLDELFAHRSTLSGLIPPFQAVIEEAHNFIPSRQEGTDETPSLGTIRRVITEGRKFGTGLVLISQRPSRLDETTLAQCNSFLVLRLVNPKDKAFVRSVMENLSESDANVLQSFGRGQGIVSGQAVRFPLLVQIRFDEDLVSDAIGDENFIEEAAAWKPYGRRQENSQLVQAGLAKAGLSGSGEPGKGKVGRQVAKKAQNRGKGIKPKF